MVKTDFNQIKELYLVYPEGVGEMSKDAEESYSHLAKFYDNLIHLIPENITIKLFAKSEKTAQRIIDLRNNIDSHLVGAFQQTFNLFPAQRIFISEFGIRSVGEIVIYRLYPSPICAIPSVPR